MRVGTDVGNLYAVIVGYTEYVSVSVKLDAINLVRNNHLLFDRLDYRTTWVYS